MEFQYVNGATTAPSVRSLVVDEQRIRPVGDFLWLWLLA